MPPLGGKDPVPAFRTSAALKGKLRGSIPAATEHRSHPRCSGGPLPDDLAACLAWPGNHSGNTVRHLRPALCRRSGCSALFLGYAENP